VVSRQLTIRNEEEELTRSKEKVKEEGRRKKEEGRRKRAVKGKKPLSK
jgi:hypothetical protein